MLPPVAMYISKFGRVVLIDPEHPLAVSEREAAGVTPAAADSPADTHADAILAASGLPPATVPATVLANRARRRKQPAGDA
jgi:hypothetical protein